MKLVYANQITFLYNVASLPKHNLLLDNDVLYFFFSGICVILCNSPSNRWKEMQANFLSSTPQIQPAFVIMYGFKLDFFYIFLCFVFRFSSGMKGKWRDSLFFSLQFFFSVSIMYRLSEKSTFDWLYIKIIWLARYYY